MLSRAIVAFLALPGVVAIGIPVFWAGTQLQRPPTQPLGLLLLGAGIAALLKCARDFYVIGRGTLAPWSPPPQLVVDGLYRRTRNPMYVSVGMILLGWSVSFESAALLAYAVLVGTAFHLRVVMVEEPELARRHGDAWIEYAGRVPRWLV